MEVTVYDPLFSPLAVCVLSSSWGLTFLHLACVGSGKIIIIIFIIIIIITIVIIIIIVVIIIIIN